MEVKAKLNYLRIAPRKVRLVADLIRGKMVLEAQAILSFTVKKGSDPLLKLLNQAVVSAQNNFQAEIDNLYISKLTVDEGPTNKRWRPRARGQAYEIKKRTSHVTLVLTEKVKSKKKVKKVEPKVEPKETVEVKKVKEVKDKKDKPRGKVDVVKPHVHVDKGVKRIFKRKAF